MAGRDFQSKPNRPVEWPVCYYRLIEAGERQDDALAVCVAHRGVHVWYLDDCHALPPHQPRRFNPRPASAPAVSITVLLDADRLGWAVADGVVTGFRRARVEQRQEGRR